MKNKGFTLIELLGVIILIMILSLLIIPAVTKIVSTGENTVYQTQIDTILTSAYDYTLKNTLYLPDENKTAYISLAQLKIEGFIDANIKDPSNNENFPDNLVISVTNVGNNFSSNSNLSKTRGGYLYTVELDKLNYKGTRPNISINGLEKNSDGNYIRILTLNSSFVLPEVSATESGVNITNNVVKYITKDNEVVDQIDTLKSGIYRIYYVVINNEGYSTLTKLTIIISDTTRPEIIVPDNEKISITTNKYNLMSGVSCTDNSGYCNITYTGAITFKTRGKYTITYTATDPSGNTSTAKRIITVE